MFTMIRDANYRWFVLALAGLTATLAIAMPSMAMPVLFSEMSEDLGLTLVQIGTIWGTVSLGGLFTALAGGAIGDRLGAKRTLAAGCLILGLTGALRGLSNSFLTLVSTVCTRPAASGSPGGTWGWPTALSQGVWPWALWSGR